MIAPRTWTQAAACIPWIWFLQAEELERQMARYLHAAPSPARPPASEAAGGEPMAKDALDSAAREELAAE
jgi:hypothetical protein